MQKNKDKGEVGISSERLPSVFEYNDFRKYLSDYYTTRRKADKSFNQSAFSKLLHLPNTRSYFGDVVRGKKLTTTFVERFVEALQLDNDEANYFRVLVKHNQSDKPDERQIYFDQLIALNKVPRRVLDKKYFEYYRNWYNSVIRAMLDYIDFKDEYGWLAKNLLPPVSAVQVKESIKLLLELKLISPDSDGYLRPTDRSISAPEYIKDELIESFQIACAEHSKKAIVANHDQERLIATNTFSISSDALETVKHLIHRFRDEIRACVNRDQKKADSTYQLNLFLFPCCKKE